MTQSRMEIRLLSARRLLGVAVLVQASEESEDLLVKVAVCTNDFASAAGRRVSGNVTDAPPSFFDDQKSCRDIPSM